MTQSVEINTQFSRTPRPGDIVTYVKGKWLPAQGSTTVNEIPIGMLMMYASGLTPPGPGTWVLCDGTSYATATYPSLFAVTAYVYGGAGANFNVPDTRGLVIAGASTSGTLLGANGAHVGPSAGGGGLYTVILQAAESGIPGPTTTGTDSPDHAHGAIGSFLVTGAAGALTAGGPANFNTTVLTGGANARHAHSIGPQNATNGHTNVQPYIAIPYWIRAT